MTALCNQPEAFTSDLGDDQSRYLQQDVGKLRPQPVMAVSKLVGAKWKPKVTVVVAVYQLQYVSVAHKHSRTAIDVHCVPKKRPPFYFSNNSVKN